MRLNRLFAGAIFALASSMSFGQTPQILTTQPISNLDQLVANIFGIQCANVSNVTMNGAAVAVGRFENGGAVGLESGLVLSTGDIAGLEPPNNPSSSLSMSGDADIESWGGNTYSSFDAAVVEFDFVPVNSDTIRFNYVFGSEEYPAWVGTGFNDKFLFLVSENGGAYQNVAVVPGTTTQVQIDSVNANVNSQYYVDNTAGGAFFTLNGHTTPLEAKFFAQAGVSYHVKLVIADVTDGILDSAVLLEEHASSSDISGTLDVNGSPAEGLLEVFNISGDTLLAVPVESVNVSAGAYDIDSLPGGYYHVRFTPDTNVHPGASPLYFTSGDVWAEADTISLPCYFNGININSTTLSVLNGSGTISGSVVIDTTYLKTQLDPFEGALLKLFDSNDQLLAFTYSDVNGDYTFTSVPAGDYYVLVDVPYIPQLNEHQIPLLEGQDVVGADFAIELTGIIAENNLDWLAIGELNQAALNVFPSPVKEKLFVNGLTQSVNAWVVDRSGKVVMQSIKLDGTNNELSVADLEPGIYFLRMQNEQRSTLALKFVKY